MKLIRSLIGRRQFMVGTLAASTSALAFRKLAGSSSVMIENEARASEASDAVGMKGAFSSQYRHLLSPLKIGNVVLKNRMTASPSMPHFVQGPEPYPSEAIITHFANKAKSGAAMVVCGSSLPSKKTSETIRWPYFEYENGPSQNYLCQLAEAIHFYNSKASMILQCPEKEGYDVSAGIPSLAVEGDCCVSTYG